MADDPKPDPTPDPVPDPEPKPDPEPEPEPFDKERAMATINKLRDEVKAAKADAKKTAALEARLKEIEDAQLTEQEKVAKERDALAAEKTAWEQERQVTNLKLAVYAQTVPLGIVDADLALAALDRSALEFDEGGNPKNIADVLLALLEAKPILKGVASSFSATGDLNAGSGQAGGKKPSLTAEELEAAARYGMTVEAYAAFKDVGTYEDYLKAREALKPAS